MKKINQKNNKGFAIGVVLFAVMLIAAIAAAISYASRGSNSRISIEKQNEMLASAIISQSVTLSRAILSAEILTDKPVELVENSDDCSGGSGTCLPLYNASLGIMPPVLPPNQSYTADDWFVTNGYVSGNQWVYRSITVYRKSTGPTLAGNFLILAGLTSGVCQAVSRVVSDTSVVYSTNDLGASTCHINGGELCYIDEDYETPNRSIPPHQCVQYLDNLGADVGRFYYYYVGPN